MSIDVADFSSADVAPQIVMVSGTHVGTGGNVTVFNATYIVPAGTHAIAIVMQRSAGAGTFTANPILTGHQSQYPYLNWALAGETSKRRIMPYFSAFDTSLDASLVLNAPVGTSVTYFLIAILDSMVVWAINNGIDAPLLGTQLFDSNGSVISMGQKTMLFSFPVVIASDQSRIPVALDGTRAATPWEFGANWTGNTSTLSAAGEATMVAAVGGQSIYVHMLSVACDTAAAVGSIRAPVGTVVHPFNLGTAGNPQILPVRGKLPVGAALILHADNGAAIVYRWSVSWSQA